MDLFGDEPAAQEAVSEEYLDAPEEAAGLQEPRASDFCRGHEAVEQGLLKQFEAGKVAHGIVFHGPKGIGKATMAYRYARFLLKHGGHDPNQESMFGDAPALPDSMDMSADDPIFRKIASGGHPDFLSIERPVDERKGHRRDIIDIETARQIMPFLRLSSADGGYRVVIVDDADSMNNNAQNAILKILEEPPKNTVLILVCHRMGAMLPTIKSRVQVLNFQSLDDGAVRDLIRKHDPLIESYIADRLTDMAAGSIGNALEALENNEAELLEEITAIFDSAPNWNWPQIHIMAEELARAGADDKFASFQKLMNWLMRSAVKAKARGKSIPHGAFLGQYPLETLSKACETLAEHFIQGNRANLEKRQIVMGAFKIIA